MYVLFNKPKVAFSFLLLSLSLAVDAQSLQTQLSAQEVKNYTNPVAWAVQMQAIEPHDPAFKRLDKVYRQSLRLGGTAHNIVPHLHTTYPDLKIAKDKLYLTDIPYIVKALAQLDKLDARQRVAVGVLGLFGAQSLPCIEAALLDPEIKGRFTLQQIKIQIKADR